MAPSAAVGVLLQIQPGRAALGISGNILGFGMEAPGLQDPAVSVLQLEPGCLHNRLRLQQRCFPACFSMWVELGRQESSGGKGEQVPGAERMC